MEASGSIAGYMPSAAMRARQHDVAVEMARDRGHRRIGEVVGRHIDRLDRGDRGAGHRGDALLQRRHFGGQRRLVADARRQPAQQAGDLAAGLDETEYVVHQQQHVLVLHVAEILGDGQRGQTDAPARAGRLVHLAEHQHGAAKHAGLFACRTSSSWPSRDRSPMPANTEMPW